MTLETTAEAAPAQPKVPVWRTVGAAYRDTFGNFGAFLLLAALPYAVSTLLSVVLTTQSAGLTYDLLNTLVEPLPVAVFECLWLRYLLLRGSERRPALLLQPQQRLLPFLGYTFILALLYVPVILISNFALAAVLPEQQVAGLLALPLLVVATYFYLRLCFALPWIAVDATGRLQQSWQRTRGNGLRLLAVICLVTVPPMLLIGLAAGIAQFTAGDSAPDLTAGDMADPGYWLLSIIFQVIAYLIYAVNIAAIAQAFCLLTGWLPNRSELLERFE